MANANFDKWLRLNKKPDESLRDAIYRFSDNTKNPRSAKEYLVDEYREAVNNEDYNKSVQEMPEQQQEGQPYAGKSEEIDPDTGEYDQYSLDDSPRRAIQQLKKTVGGSMSTLGFQDTGMEWSREADKRLSQIASPPTREEIEKEGGILGDIYGKLPEGFLGPGQLVEQSLPSLAPYTGSVAGMLVGGPIGGFLGGYALSNLQVAGETHDRIIDDPIVKRELDIPDVPYEDLTPTQQKKLKDFALDVSRSAGLRRMYTSGLIEAPALFVPAFNVNKLIPEFIKRQALDITFGSASEVLDEELYASNVANALMDKGMDEATGAMVKKEIRDMGPEAWEIFWGAFSQELTMGSAGTGAEILASRILGKNKDYRVDDTKTNQNELINTLTKEQEEKLPEYEKQAREDQDRQDKKDREDREEQVKLDNAKLDFAIKLDQLNLNREKAEQDRVKAEEERLDRMIEQEETFAKNLPKVLPLVEQQRIYARKKAALVKQGWDPKSIYMDNEGEARIKIGADLEGLTEDDVRPDKVTGKPVPVTPDLTKPRAGEKIKVFNKDGEQVEVKVTKSQGPNVTVVGPRKKGPDGKFVKPVPSLLDTDTGQFFSNNPTEQVADEVAPVKKPLSEFSITELLNEESKLEKQAPTPQLKDQNVELQNIKTEIAKRDERMLNEEATERFDRLREDGTVSYSETTPKVDPNQLNVPEPIRQANEIVEELDAQEPASLSNPVLQKVLDGVVSKFNKLKIDKIKFEVTDRNRAYEIKLNRLRKDYEKATGNQPQGTEDDIALQAQAKVNSTGLGAYVDNRPDKDGSQRIVLISDNIRGKTNEDVIRRAIQQTWHELFGHRALRDNFGGIDGKEYKDIIKEFDKNNGRDVDSWLKTSGETGGSGYVNEPRFRQVEEFIARNFAEYGISTQGKFRKLISSIREKLRAKGFTTIREQDLIAIFEKLQDEYIPNNRSIISGKKLSKPKVSQVQPEEETATKGEQEEVSESRGRRPSDFDRFVSLGGKPPLKQYDRPKFDTARAPKKTAKDAERYVDASLLASMKGKAWPERLVEDLMNFDKFPKEFQEGFRKSLKSGLREPEQKLANAILASGREAYLKKKKGAAWRDRDKWALTQPPKGYEANGAKWKELVDDVPKWARTTAEVQRGMREQDISESTTYFPDQKLKPIFPMPPKAFPGGYAEQKWANRLDPEDTPVYRKGGRFIDVSRGFPVKDSDPDMTNTIVPFGEIDTDFPGSRASFGVSGAVSKIKNLADNKPKKGQRKVNGKRISTGSAIMTNLLTKKFKFLDTNPNVKTNTENIATMENGAIVKYNKENDQSATKAGNFSDHLYAVQIVFDTDVQLFNTGKDKNQPSLRPRTYGDILVGDQVGTIQLDTGTVAPLYDRLIVVPPSKDEISYSFVGEVGVRQFITRNGMNPKGKMLTRDLNRQKKGSKEGAWFNPGLADGKWRVEVPNTGIKLKTMPFKYEGWRDTYNTVIDPSLPTRKQVFMPGDKNGNPKKQKTGEALPYMRLGDLLDLGALVDYYPQLDDVYVHFADEFMGERMGYSSAFLNPADNNPTGEGLSLTIGMAPPDPETMRGLDMDRMTMTTQGWIEDIHMKMMNDPNHDGVPHRLIATILHEVQHIIQEIEGFSSGGQLTEKNITKDRIKNAIRNSTKGLWVSINPGKRLRIQKRFASTLNDLVNNDQKKAKDAVSKFGLKSPFVGKKWSDGSLFLDEDPTKTYQRWSKTTTISVTDLINDPNEASNRKFENLVSLPSKAMMQTIGSLSREKIISGKDAEKVHKLFENMLKPYTMNALGSMMGNQIPSGFAPDQMKRLMGQSDYFRLAGEVEARDVENRYLDAFRGNGRSGLPSLLNKRKQELVKRLSPSKPYLQGGTERGVVNIDESGTGTTPVNVPGEAVLGSPWRIEDMISYSMSDPLGDFAERVDIVTRARVAQINNLEKGTPQRREAIRQLHLDLILHPIPFKDPTKGLPYQEELKSSVPYEDLSWSQRLPGHELSGEQLAVNYAKDPAKWETIRIAKGGYEKSGAGGRGEGPIITGLGLKEKVSLKKKKGESDSDYKTRLKKHADKDFKTLKTRAAKLLYQGKIWTNWQKIRDMFGLNEGGRGRDAVPYLGHIINFMKMQREKLMSGKMTPRDIAKSVVMTLASQGADANNPWTVYNFTGGVKKAKAYKKNKYPASLKTFAEYMNAADWTNGEANIGQKELNGVLTEKAIVDYYNKAPLWGVNVPWNGEGPNGDMQYQQISDGVLYPKTVSWDEASKTPKYGTNGEPKDEMQYTGSKPQLVKVGKDWMLRIDGKDYSGMKHYMRAKRNEAFVKNIEDVKRPEIKKKIAKYEKTIEEINANEKLDAEAKAKKIKKNQEFLAKNKKALTDLDKKIEKDNKETEAVAKRMFAEMPLWFKNPGKEKAPSDKTGAVWVPQEYATTGGKPRMEDAVAYYFSTPDGQKVLDDIENGKFELKDWRKLANVRMAFGDDRLTQLLKPAQRKKNGEFEKVGLQDLTEYTEQFNQIVKNHIVDLNPKDLQGNDGMAVKLRLDLAADLGNFAQKLYGIAEAKQAFFKHFLGLGDAPTIDAIELNTHIAGSPATDLVTSPLTGEPVANTWRVDLKWWSLKLQKNNLSSIPKLGMDAMASGKTFFAHYRDTIKKAFDDIREDVDARDPNIFEDVPPDYFYHVMHHWLWDVGKALTRADAVMGKSTERFRPAAYEAMWRDANQQVLSYFRNDPIEATMVDWEPGHNQPDAVAEISEGDVELLEDISESVSLASMKGKLVQRSVSDRFITGFYIAKDQTSNIWPDTYRGKKGYWMRGGMGYPLLEDNIKARAAWAANDEKIVKDVRDLQAMGADHVVTVVGAPDMHFSNKAYFAIFWRETQDMVSKDPKKKQALIDRIDSIVANPPNQSLTVFTKRFKETQVANPGKDSWEITKMVAPTLSFGNRKPVVVALGGAYGVKSKNIVGYPNNALWEDTTAFKEVAVGTPVGIIKLDPMGNQKMDQRAKDLGIPPHEAYEFVFKGEVIGSWIGQQGGVPFDNKQFRQLFKNYENKIIKKFKYKQGTFDISAGSKYMFRGAKVPFKIPGGEIKKLEKNMDAPATPVSFSMVVNTLATDPRLQADFNNAQLKQAEWATSQSIFTRPLDQDKEIPGGRKLSGFVTRFMEPFGKLDMPQTLRDIRRRARGRILRVEEIGSRLYKALYKTQNQKEIYEYLSTKGGDPSTIPNLKERAAAKEVKAQIEKVGQQLVDRGLLNQAALDKYGDGYLPKVYLQYLLDDNDRYAIQRGLGSKVSNMDYLKKRGDIKEPIAKLVKGQVKDPAFLGSRAIMQPGRDIALLDMFEEIVVTSQDHGLNWVLPESLVKFSYLDEINKVAQQDSQLNYDLRDELANNESEKQEIESYIADLTKDIDKEREILRAKDRIQSKELNQMVKERNGMRDRLKMYKPKAMSGWALKAEAERIRTTIAPTFDVDSDDYSVVLKLAGRLEKLANDAIGSIIIPKDYMKIPDQARYGRLRGMIVQREIYDDLVGSMKMVEPDNVAEAIIGDSGLLGRANRLFKWSKVTANFPAAWVRNFSSNLVFMNVGGMNMARIPYYLTKATGEMIKTWKGQKSIYDDVKDLGLTGSTFAAVELGRIEKEYENFLNRVERKQKKSPWRAFFMAKEFLTMAQDWTSDKYGLVDSLGKTMMYMNGIDKGMSPSQAADEAEKWLFDYSLVKPSVKKLRNAVVGAPFLTYTTKVFPLLVETALTKPWRFAPYIALPYAMAALFKDNHDLDDEEYEALMYSLPEYLREKRYAGNIMPLPYLDENGRAQFLDLAYLYPWGMFTEIASEAQDNPGDIIQTLGLLGGPTASLITVISSGVDPFTRRPVSNKLDSNTQQWVDKMKYVYNLMMPPFLHTDYGALSRLRQTMNGELNRYGEPMKTLKQGLSQTLGFNVSPIDPTSQRAKNARYLQSEILKTQGFARRELRGMARSGKSSMEIREKSQYFKDLIKERQNQLKEYLKKSKFPAEKLKQAN